MNPKHIEDAARFLIAMRDPDAALTESLPDDLRPRDPADVIAIQLETMRLAGSIGGWKVGAPSPVLPLAASPLPLPGIHRSPATVTSRFRGVEAEIGFRFGKALPPRATPYSADEVIDAIEDCVTTIEILDPRFRNHTALDPLSAHADLGSHWALVVADPIASWTPAMFATLSVRLDIDGETRCTATGSNPAGTDLMRLLVWLANSDVVKASGGLKAGAIATTGSWTGMIQVPAGAVVTAYFDGFSPVKVSFSA
jgi:hypothetical protein